VFAGNNGEIPTPGFNAAIDVGLIEMESHEFQFIGNRLRRAPALHRRPVLLRGRRRAGQPADLLAADRIHRPQGAYTPGSGPLYDAAGFCPPAYGGYLCVGSQRLPIPAPTIPTSRAWSTLYYGQNTESWAAYGQATYAVTDQFDLTLGIRYTEDEKDAFLYNQNIAGFNPRRADQGRRQVGQHQLPGQRQLRDHRRYQRLPDLRHRLQRRRLQRAREQRRRSRHRTRRRKSRPGSSA
jgi:hypothetical protein